MRAGRFSIDEAQIEALRERHPYDPDESWVPDLAATEGWLAVNRYYLNGERERSERAMRDLMHALGVVAVTSAEEAADLLELAVYVFTPTGGFLGEVTRPEPGTLRIENSHCPTFRLIEEQNWHGLTACASSHRRRGWFDALGIHAVDTVLCEQKWGDPSCIASVSVDRVLALPS